MAGAIIWSIIVFGCAFLFLGIGIYASKREKPMWFYSGTTVDASKISDVKAYNRENARMWALYSLWYFASGAVYFWKAWIAVVLLVLRAAAARHRERGHDEGENHKERDEGALASGHRYTPLTVYGY
jgi:hypothetical protein